MVRQKRGGTEVNTVASLPARPCHGQRSHRATLMLREVKDNERGTIAEYSTYPSARFVADCIEYTYSALPQVIDHGTICRK